MKWPTIVAIFFTTWWVVIFAVLPFGISNANEEGQEAEQGHDPGAPMKAGLLWKAGMTTVLAMLVTAGIVYSVNSGLFSW